MDRIDNLVYEDSVEGMQDMRGVQVEIAMFMVDDGIDATEVQALISHVNQDAHRRVIDRVLSEMLNEGLRGATGAIFHSIYGFRWTR